MSLPLKKEVFLFFFLPVLGLCCCRGFSCSEQGLLSGMMHGLLVAVASPGGV